MKYCMLALGAGLWFCVGSVSVFAQKAGEYRKVYLKNDSTASGVVVQYTPSEFLRLKLETDSTMIIPAKDILKTEAIAPFVKGSLALCSGIPFGTFGLNPELEFVPRMAITCGLGIGLLSIDGKSKEYVFPAVGIRLYPAGSESTWRFRLSAWYGANGALALKVQTKVKTVTTTSITFEGPFYGWTFGAGLQVRLQKAPKLGWDLDLMYTPSPGANDRMKMIQFEMSKPGVILSSFKEQSTLSVAIGVRYFF